MMKALLLAIIQKGAGIFFMSKLFRIYYMCAKVVIFLHISKLSPVFLHFY